MQGYRCNFFSAVSAAAIIIFSAIFYGAPANAGDTVFTAIDLTTVSILSESRGFDPTPFILWREISTYRYSAWLMTLNSLTGAQMGMRTTISFTSGEVPAAILWSKHFLDIPSRGVEPSPFIIFRDYRLRFYTVMHDFDGTPIIETEHSQLLMIDPVYGLPTCMTELPGSAFPDGYPRLCVGTDNGHLILLINTFVAGIAVDEIIRPSYDPIADLEPIPQNGFVALGILTGRMLYGYKFLDPLAKSGGNRHLQIFTIEDIRPDYATDFDVFGTRDEPLPGPDYEVSLVLANNTAELALENIAAEQTGFMILDPDLETHDNEIQMVAAGSLLMLLTDGSGVRFDPAYEPGTGSGGCDIDITDGNDDDCAIICGDANGDGDVNVGDAVFVISYVFKGGSAPNPVCAGDANGDSDTNVGDAVYMISYVFKGGPPPVEYCCP